FPAGMRGIKQKKHHPVEWCYQVSLLGSVIEVRVVAGFAAFPGTTILVIIIFAIGGGGITVIGAKIILAALAFFKFSFRVGFYIVFPVAVFGSRDFNEVSSILSF